MSTDVLTLLEESLTLERSGEIAAALQRARQALEAARLSGEPQEVAMALVAVARYRFRLGQYATTRSLAQEALSITMPTDKTASAHAEALVMMAMCACEAQSLSEAETYYRRAAELAQEIGHQLLRLRVLHGLGGGVYLPRGQFDLALAAAEEAHHLAYEHDLREWLGYPLITIVWACQMTGRVARARAGHCPRFATLGLLSLSGSKP